MGVYDGENRGCSTYSVNKITRCPKFFYFWMGAGNLISPGLCNLKRGYKEVLGGLDNYQLKGCGPK